MNRVKPVLLISTMFLLSACVSGPVAVTATLLPADTISPPSRPTDTPLPPTSTPVPPTPTPEFQQFFTEKFQGDYAKRWSHFLRRGKEEKFSLSATSDGLVFQLTGLGIYSYLVYEPFEYEEVRVEATVENLGVNDNNITLFCRYSVDRGWYEFNVYSSGLYDIFFTKPDSAGNLNYGLIAEGGSNKINMGHATNKYAIVCKKDSLTLLINDVQTRSVGIPGYVLTNGKVGISVSSFGQVPVKVLFKEVNISRP